MDIIVFTDGACQKNGKVNARAGYGIHFPNKEMPDISEPLPIKPCTNQRAELYAIYIAVKLIIDNPNFNSITIYTDSMYSINCLTKWIYKWQKENSLEDKKNLDLILPLVKMINSYKNITIKHVFSHTGKKDFESIGNEMADKLAVKGKEKYK